MLGVVQAVNNMDNWLYKLASSSVFDTESSDISWEDTDLLDFKITVYVEKDRKRVSEEKNMLKRDVVLNLFKNNIPGNWTIISGHPNYDILKSTFSMARPVDKKFQFDSISSMPSFNYIKAIKLDWDNFKHGI